MGKDELVYDEELADRQVELITECYDELNACIDSAAFLEKGQTPEVWTADGKAVELTAMLKEKYRVAGPWLNDLCTRLDDAKTNLRTAIAETKELNEQQKADYDRRLSKLMGPNPLKYPKAI
ncbi:hypothetical protein [Microbacterium halotolerans]|uniref:hypothetical protein n=1 Tax=Microbacterium halotolerans TaxID=246613 RepID=UPI000E6A95D8|nr:hypothetical protein [Microbacterium halotolerans]